MLRRLSREQLAALVFVLARTAWCTWSAATLSLVHDEAQTFNTFLNGSWHDAYFLYTSNNHVLFSLLAKACLGLLGVSEFAMRLPTVLGGFFLMWGVWRVLEQCESRSARWIGFVAIGLHPLMLDFSITARGYGVSLAFLVWAIYEANKQRAALAGFLLGLSVAANFTAALPAAGLIIAAALLAGWPANQGEQAFSPALARLRTLATMTAPAALAVAAICGGALRVLQRGELYAGAATLRDSLYSLIFTSIHATPRNGLAPPALAAGVILYGVLPALTLFLVLNAWGTRRRNPIVPAALALAAAAAIAAHRFAGLLYPLDRTGLPWLLLFALAWALAAGSTANVPLRRASLFAGCLLALQFMTQFHAGYLTLWWYDSRSQQIARRIEAETRAQPAGSVSISATWVHQPALEFYRVRDRVTPWKPVERREPTPLTGYDYYVLNQPDTDSAAAHAWTVLFSDPFSGAVLAR